jgi:hypothetical protein
VDVLMTAAEVFAAVGEAQAALEALTVDTPDVERAQVEAAYQAATAAMFDLL